MSDAWVGVVGALVGVLAGALSENLRSRWVFSKEKWWFLLEDRRRRFEELYTLVEDHRDAFRDSFGRAVMAFETHALNTEGMARISWARVRMLVALYAPELLGDLARLEQHAKEYGQVLANIVRAKHGEAEQLKSQLFEGFKRLESCEDDFVVHVVGVANQLQLQALSSTETRGIREHLRGLTPRWSRRRRN